MQTELNKLKNDSCINFLLSVVILIVLTVLLRLSEKEIAVFKDFVYLTYFNNLNNKI